MIRQHRTTDRLFVITGQQLNAIADALDRDAPLAGEGLDFLQVPHGRLFFIAGQDFGGASGVTASPDLPALPKLQVTSGSALNELQAAIRARRGFGGVGVGMKAGTRGRIFSIEAPFWTPPFPPPDPPPDPSSSSSQSGSSSGSDSGSGPPDPPDPGSDSSSSSSSSGS